jgi:hypothetical protein
MLDEERCSSVQIEFHSEINLYTRQLHAFVGVNMVIIHCLTFHAFVKVEIQLLNQFTTTSPNKLTHCIDAQTF